MADGKVTILVDVDGKQVKVLNDELERVSQKGQQGSRSLKDFAAGSLIFKATGAALNLLNQSLDKAIQRYDTLQRFPRVMESMGHSTTDVANATKMLSDGIEGLPTTLDEVVGTAQRLTSLTGDLEKSTKLTLALNNAFLASGASSADASRGLQQFSQMLSSGKVDMQSWKTLQETMPYALQKTAESFGFAGASAQNDFYSALQGGRITFDQFSKKLIELNGGVGGFAELAKTNSEGIQTSFGNLRNAIAKGLASLIESFDKVSKAVTGKSIAKNIDSLKVIVNASFKLMSGAVEASIPFFKLFFDAVKVGIVVIKPLSPLLAGITAAFVAFKVVSAVTALIQAQTVAVGAFNTVLKLATLNQNVNTAAYMVNAGVLKAGTVLYGLIAGQISLMSVAQIAGSATTGLWTTAVTLFNAAWAANPIGLVIVAMAGLIAAGTALWNWLNRDSEETKKLKAEQENLVAQTDELTKSVNEHAKARRDAVQENSSSSKSYKALADEIVKLSQVENKTAGEKKNLQKKIEILNGAVDSLNLAYDKNTNSLSHNTQQLYDRIDAMEAESQWATAQESLLAIEQERVDLSKQLTEVSKQRNEVTTAQNITDGERQKLLGELAGKESELKIALENNRLEYTSTAEAQSAAAEVMAAAAEAGSNRQVIAYENMSEAQKTAVDNMRQRFQELLDTTTNMFGQIEQKTAISVEQINANLEANRVATEQWATNLQVLAERGVDQGILEQLRQMGPEGAAQTQVFVNATDAELAVLQENFRRNGEAAKTALNSELSSAGQEIPEGVRNLVTNVSSGLQAELAAADFASLGKEIPNGVGQGITAGTQQSSEAARKMSEITKKAFQQDMGINSPSRVFTEYGGHITTGLANGIANNSSTPVGRVADLANNMKTPFLGFQNYFVSIGSMAMQGLAAGISLGSGSALSAAAIVAGQVKSTIQKALDIHSPSRVMRDEVGRFIPQGIALGIDEEASVVEKSMNRLKDSMLINAKPEVALGLDKNMGMQITVKQTSKQSISEKIELAMSKSNDMVQKALEVAEEAVKKPSYMVMDTGAMVGSIGKPISNYQDNKLKLQNMLEGRT